MWFSGKLVLGLAAASQLCSVSAYWMEYIEHQGISPYHNDSSYKVFRNVKSFGAVGDGVTDDTDAINLAISTGNRCGMKGACSGSTVSPATVYFPSGTYLVSSAIISLYYTQIIGDPSDMPIIKASSSLNITDGAVGIIEGNSYGGPYSGLSYEATNNFFRQIRNIIIDTTDFNGSVSAIHFPGSQATTIQNVEMRLSKVPGNEHTGIFIESGSGGFIGDIVVHGGKYGAQLGNQQFTTRNMSFYDCDTAINHFWDWFWVYKSLYIENCTLGINMSVASVGSVTILDSVFNNTLVGINAGRGLEPTSNITSRGTLVMENTLFSFVDIVYQAQDEIYLSGGTGTTENMISGTILGNIYTPSGPDLVFDGPEDYFPTINALRDGNKYFEHPKPLYFSASTNSVFSARTFGAKGDGVTDDTDALNALLLHASQHFATGGIAFLDAGHYMVTDTIYVPPNTRIVGEALASVILGAGANFQDMESPRPVVQVASAGEKGVIEWSDTIVSTQGPAAGAVVIEYNLGRPASNSSCSTCGISGMWDVHVRVGGFKGTNLQLAECAKTPELNNQRRINPQCIAAHTSVHITKTASGLYTENNWIWTADHDIDSVAQSQISIYAARGLLIESQTGPIWIVGSGSEHHTLYQYQLLNTKNIYMGQIQSETPYYQPNPPAPYPFTTPNTTIQDPEFKDCPSNQTMMFGANITSVGSPAGACGMAWALRVIDSSNVAVYGAGLYSFFNNYNTTCSNGPLGPNKCQARITEIKGTAEDVVLYDYTTIGSRSMVNVESTEVALAKDNPNVFGDTFALFMTGETSGATSAETSDPSALLSVVVNI